MDLPESIFLKSAILLGNTWGKTQHNTGLGTTSTCVSGDCVMVLFNVYFGTWYYFVIRSKKYFNFTRDTKNRG